MKQHFFIFNVLLLLHGTPLQADDSDWQDDSWDTQAQQEMEQENEIFKEMEIKNRSKKEYQDRVYKYIENEDYVVKNNNIEIATVELSDDLRSQDIEVNVLTENLKVEGDAYRGDSIPLKRNDYKYFVNHDESAIELTTQGDEFIEEEANPKTIIETSDPLYEKVPDEDVSELEVIDLRDKPQTKEVNVYIKNTTIRVDDDYQDQ